MTGFTYTKQPDGWQRAEVDEPVNPDDYQLHVLPELPGVVVGVRYEKDGKIIVPEEDGPNVIVEEA